MRLLATFMDSHPLYLLNCSMIAPVRIVFALCCVALLAMSCGSEKSAMLTAKDCPHGVKKNNHKIDKP
jgi:hypothetical protein